MTRSGTPDPGVTDPILRRGYPLWADPADPLLRLPKISLHDHLDGSVRPETLLELADEQGVSLPHTDPDRLAGWFQGTVPEPAVRDWDEKFGVTTRLTRTPEALSRVAREQVFDLAADGVVYAEIRWAPEKHETPSFDLDAAVVAVAQGLDRGERAARAAGYTVRVRQLLCAMRTSDRSREIAELAIRHRGAGVVGFDLAGEETGHPASLHRDALRLLDDEGVPYTLHAAEHDGLASLRDTLASGRPARLGHGVRVIEDITVDSAAIDARNALACMAAAGPTARIGLGPTARHVLEQRIPLEVCVTSNSGGGVVDQRRQHPVDLLRRLGFVTTINPDNRLMSATSVTREFRHLVDTFAWTAADLDAVTRDAARATFATDSDRAQLRLGLSSPEVS